MRTHIITTIIALASFILCAQLRAETEPTKEMPMSQNKTTVQTYMDSFSRSDHKAILACLTEDVEWVIPGLFHVSGKAAFDKEIENDAFVGSPIIKITRMTEDKDVVVAEGSVRSERKDGSPFDAVFCDVFEMQDGKIKRLISYLMEIKE